MKRIAQFSKVSYEQFSKDVNSTFIACYDDEAIRTIYDNIKLPTRATRGSAGYDFSTPFYIYLKVGDTIKIPTGIRCNMSEDWMLGIYPRSGLGFKYRLQLDNSVGICDSDFFFSDNEGHIFLKISNCGLEGKEVRLNIGDAFAQGIFTEYGITHDDNVVDIRNGGFNSTKR